MKYIAGRRKQAGAALLIIIIAMLVIAVLGIALYALTFTATLNQVIAQRAAKAFYLAESGIRIAASEYKAALHTSTTVADNKLANLHNQTFTMPDNVSTIQIQIYPYWLYAPAAIPVPTSSITLYLPGAVPPIDDTGTTAITFPATGLLKIEDVRAGRPSAWVGDPTTTFVSYTTVSPVHTLLTLPVAAHRLLSQFRRSRLHRTKFTRVMNFI